MFSWRIIRTLLIIYMSGVCVTTVYAVTDTQPTCANCHSKQSADWHDSDHAKAMLDTTPENVLGDFNNKTINHHEQIVRFYKRSDKYLMTVTDKDTEHTLVVKYTFGHSPLQQYLVETQNGRLQVLPFSWDSRAKNLGGQRWYANYTNEMMTSSKRLHWTQPLQNWNGMCADCHSTGLKRHYDSESNTFNTTFKDVNVSCNACHTELNDHAEKHLLKSPNTPATHSTKSLKNQSWVFESNGANAVWHGPKRDNSFMDNCFSCHSRRLPLTDGITTGAAFLDQFIPQLPISPYYHADGQIKDEVYVYGSFLQSKMYDAGVNCLDCHDKHTMKVKLQGNGLCLQCHSNDVYNSYEHHRHQTESAGSLCVNCHMPETEYMGVDKRRDHSFKIPRPHLSARFSTPNSCNRCHENKSAQWASNAVNQWHGKPKPLTMNEMNLVKLNLGLVLSDSEHWNIINDSKISIIRRASALQLLKAIPNAKQQQKLIHYLKHDEPLLRLAAIEASKLMPSTMLKAQLLPLLNDAYKAVRISASRTMILSGMADISHPKFVHAFEELMGVSALNSWRGEGLVEHAALLASASQLKGSEKALIQAIELDPYHEVGYINLADLYQSQKRENQAKSILEKGIVTIPRSSIISYALGLHFVRTKQLDLAMSHIKKAMLLDKTNPHYAYTYVLVLDSLGQSEKALKQLRLIIKSYTDKSNLNSLGLDLALKLGDMEAYQEFR
ncbi:hypothetical protein PAUR_b0108 [Pseudoalteromonas aurantia 208]|uniref:Uncharacterized protein n=2 Tax=Pseudoalteromonas aurantia TaxID=43654 RepID=A0ABR9EIS6_9GAMM|nr:hypothetical protein [Pseudoalteromonas aurantia 208]